jgi:tryptophanyl-tRNA synthetase
MRKPRILSGVQPTGNLHLGNYLGAIRNWVEGQSQYENFFCVVDLHAITVPHDPATLASHTYKTAALYLACGIDLAHAHIFVQSQVTAHAELTWLLNCITPLNWLEDMIQFKEKAIKQGQNVGTGLLDYPVLMAADILLYDADKVPVGEDQKQHLELTRDIAVRVNHLFGIPTQGKKGAKEEGKGPIQNLANTNPQGYGSDDSSTQGGDWILKVPEPLIRPQGARVMSLTDGTSKMSKSDPSEQSRINLLDTPEEIAKKIKRCKTDPHRGLEFNNPDRPECHNLLSLYMILAGKTQEAVQGECADMGWGQFKPLLTEATIAALAPIQQRYEEVMASPDYLQQVLRDGQAKANGIAQETLTRVKSAMGFALPG